jgi:shikimate dehydrogenase
MRGAELLSSKRLAMKRFGVIGHPIAHSLSPLLHNTAFSQLGLECRYDAFDIEPASLATAIHDFKGQGYSGLNVTIPHKEPVVAFMDELSKEAKAVGAVNTISFNGNRIRGDNTDVHGVAASLGVYQSDIRGTTAVVLGAGGSARGVVYALIELLSAGEVVVVNRNLERAQELIADLKPYAKQAALRAVALSSPEAKRAIEQASTVINATSAGMHPAVNESPIDDSVQFHSDQIVMDLIYTPLETRFLNLASRSGARTISGLEMFLHQGARSFEIWLGRTMPVSQLRTIILNELNARHTLTEPRA